jgi:hypothetical protein
MPPFSLAVSHFAPHWRSEQLRVRFPLGVLASTSTACLNGTTVAEILASLYAPWSFNVLHGGGGGAGGEGKKGGSRPAPRKNAENRINVDIGRTFGSCANFLPTQVDSHFRKVRLGLADYILSR